MNDISTIGQRLKMLIDININCPILHRHVCNVCTNGRQLKPCVFTFNGLLVRQASFFNRPQKTEELNTKLFESIHLNKYNIYYIVHTDESI